jgi:hypothetical protein
MREYTIRPLAVGINETEWFSRRGTRWGGSPLR